MIPGSARNWIAVNAVQQSTSTKKTKYDNSTLKKINRPVAFAACSPSHPARVRLLCAFARILQAAKPTPPPGEDRGNGNSAAENVQALNLGTTRANNTAHGWFSLFSNTTGHDNTANGYEALFSNTTGNFNTAVGTSALQTQTQTQTGTADGNRTRASPYVKRRIHILAMRNAQYLGDPFACE